MSDDAIDIETTDRFLTCRHLLYREGRPEEDEEAAVCAEFCRTPIGVVALLDCPVWIGRTCRFFEVRDGDPVPRIEADLEEMREKLRVDYMRWRYFKRVRDLRESRAVAIAAEEEPPSDLAEPPPERAEGSSRRAPRFPGDAPSGPPPKPVEEVDLDHLPDLTPGPDQSPESTPASEGAPEKDAEP